MARASCPMGILMYPFNENFWHKKAGETLNPKKKFEGEKATDVEHALFVVIIFVKAWHPLTKWSIKAGDLKQKW